VYNGNDSSHRTQSGHVNDSNHTYRAHHPNEFSALNIDRMFVKIVDEIHYEYMKFDKAERIRIENWVNKLVSTACINTSVLGAPPPVFPLTTFLLLVCMLGIEKNGSIFTKKERNIYAKMLLNCVLRRSLTTPFDKNPPDGILQIFPRELYLNNKGSLIASAPMYTHLFPLTIL